MNLHGHYTSASGRAYKYYGRCVPWVPGRRSYWEAFVYDTDKKFLTDDVRTSRDMLVKFEGELLNTDMGLDLVKALGQHATHEAIEAWEATLCGVSRSSLSRH